MSRYRRVPTNLWGRTSFRTLSRPPANAQTLLVYFIAGPETTIVPGLISAGEAALAEALHWRLDHFRRAFRELETQQLAQADWPSRVVWIPSVLADNPPESTNVARAWRTAFDEMPDGPLTTLARTAAEALIQGLSEPFQKAFAEGSRKTIGKTLPIQEQYQEQIPGTGAVVPSRAHPHARPPAGSNGTRPSSPLHPDRDWQDPQPATTASEEFP